MVCIVSFTQLVHRNAVVVGGTAGIGRGIAVRLAKAGANVIILGRSEVSVWFYRGFLPCDLVDARISLVVPRLYQRWRDCTLVVRTVFSLLMRLFCLASQTCVRQ